ncbi:hypothetical protein ACFLY2_02300 [Patescibacteria group bacterium]
MKDNRKVVKNVTESVIKGKKEKNNLKAAENNKEKTFLEKQTS